MAININNIYINDFLFIAVHQLLNNNVKVLLTFQFLHQLLTKDARDENYSVNQNLFWVSDQELE